MRKPPSGRASRWQRRTPFLQALHRMHAQPAGKLYGFGADILTVWVAGCWLLAASSQESMASAQRGRLQQQEEAGRGGSLAMHKVGVPCPPAATSLPGMPLGCSTRRHAAGVHLPNLSRNYI